MDTEGSKTEEKGGNSQHNSTGLMGVSRRSLLHLSGTLGAAGLMSFPAAGAVKQDDDNSERDGEAIKGTTVTGEETSTGLIDSISSTSIQNQTVSSTFRGATEQAKVFSQPLQGFPESGDEFIVLSSGRAADALGNPSTFVSTNITNGQSNPDYSPNGYDAFNIVDLEVTISLPDNAEGIEFDYKFATEENPSYLNSQYQDFFEVQFYDPDGGVQNLALIDGEPVTVKNANTIANSPGGTSNNPEPPLPSPQDIRYNSITELQTVIYDVSDYQGQSITLVFRVADASDGFFDSAAFIDGLRFTNDIDTDPTPLRNALESYEQSFKKYTKRQFEAQGEFLARLYNEHGNEYGDSLTSYWGYKSGNLPASSVTDGVREITTGTTNTITEGGSLEVQEEDAQILYNFYNDLFSHLNEGDSLQQHIQTATQFFLGTHPDQNSYLKFDGGKTVADGITQDWQLSTDVYDRLNQEVDLTQSDIQRIASALEDRADRFTSRGQQDIQSKRRAAAELLDAEESSSAEIHAQRLEKPTGGQAVEGEIAASTAFIATLMVVGAGGLAAGYVATKCSGAYTAAQSAEGVEFNAVTLTRPDQAVIGTVTTFLNQGAAIANYGEYAGETQSQAFYTSLFTSNFIAGQKAAALDLALQTSVIFNKASLSNQISAEITNLELPNVTEAVEMGTLQSFVNSVKGFFDDLLGGWYSYSPPQIGSATGSVTVRTENPVGDNPIQFKPVFGSDYKLFDGNELAGTAHPFEIKGDMSAMETGEERTFDIEYKAPLDRGLLSGEGSVEFGVSPVSQLPVTSKTDLIPVGICELDYNAMKKASDTGEFTVNDGVDSRTIAQQQAQSGETATYSYTPGSNTNQALLTLNYDNHYSDLHLYDNQNNEVGYDYASNSTITEIPGATYSGRDTGQTNSEWISLPVNSGSEYTVEVVTPEVGTVGQDNVSGTQSPSVISEYSVNSTEVGDLPPKLTATPSTVSVTSGVATGDMLDLSLTLDEVNNEQVAEGVTVTASDLTGPTGQTIPSSNVSFASSGVNVSSPTEIGFTIDIPTEIDSGAYSGTFTVTSSNADSLTIDTEVTVESEVFEGIVSDYDSDNNQEIDLTELGQAAADFASGDLNITELSKVAQAYATTSSN